METIIIIGGILLIVIGFLGSALPVLPGPPLAWVGYLLLRWSDRVSDNQHYTTWLWIMLAVVILVTLLDYIVPVWGTKRWGGSKSGMIGATAGLFIGLFLGPLGIIIGPFAGAFIGELTTGKREQEALRSGWGSFLGFLLGVGLKLMACAMLLFLFIHHLVW